MKTTTVTAIAALAALLMTVEPWDHGGVVEPVFPADAPCLACNDKQDPNLEAVEAAAYRVGLSTSLARAIAHVESNLDPSAVSAAGAIGLMQVVPESAGREVYRLRGLDGFPSAEALKNPHENADIGASYLKHLQNSLGHYGPRAVVAAYNAGPTRVRACLKQGQQWLTCLPAETQEYLTRVDALIEGGIESAI